MKHFTLLLTERDILLIPWPVFGVNDAGHYPQGQRGATRETDVAEGAVVHPDRSALSPQGM